MVRLARALSVASIASVFAFASLICCAPRPLLAQDTAQAASPPAGDDLKILRQMLDQQSRQLDVLAQEIARLNLLLEGKTPTASGLAPSPAEAMPQTPPPAPSSGPFAPKAVAVDAAPSSTSVHIVTKGETLTAIAKAYKVRVADLLKVNKITDVRKLQIGQSLALPPGAKLQESPTPTPPQQ